MLRVTMRKNGFVRLLLSLLVLSQFAAAYALVPSAGAAIVAGGAAHCQTHAGHRSPLPASGTTANCCQQPAGCHCPQASALQPPDVLLGRAFADVVPRVRPPAPPLQQQSDELFRPPI